MMVPVTAINKYVFPMLIFLRQSFENQMLIGALTASI